MKFRPNFRTIVVSLVVLVFLAATPSALRYAYQHGGFYFFSAAFLQDLPKRLTGPGRLRFIFQPVVAILLGIRSGKADAAAGRPPYILAVVSGSQNRIALLKEALAQLSALIAVAILLDCISQFLILRQVFPGAALVVGPVLIAIPYALSRALSNRWVRPKEPAH